ncbi:response regulator [Neomoorella humiferrea]|uniref:Stage 0 sporulation protein A homolog n=1 Tax=Neomoorella humiferrea TaxID=676965 RepID=A0A2T0AQN1_9FIRM|nr:response regulator [Moorella humiferrea]PRR71646.1 hypothetical protein MOHU_16300 [Moorella humiferrea]
MARVLIVDDSSAVRAYHASILVKDGHQVDFADNGYEGLEKFCAADYDVVLVDINMPRMHGYDMVRAIRRIERGQKVGIIVVSTEADSKDMVEGYKAGADLYMVKPVKPEELKQICTMFSPMKGEGNDVGEGA